MFKFKVMGGIPLQGEIEVRGSKNAASKLMIASLLTEEPCILENLPLSKEIEITEELCTKIGSEIKKIGDHAIEIKTPEVKNSLVTELSRKNRIPILALGPLLHRKGIAEVPVLGGCPIGHRPINFHLDALNKMGVKIERRENSYYAEAEEIQGAEIDFPFPSVGATENVILAAVLAEGKTFIKNAAVEPEIINLIEMLQAMGAKISCDMDKRTVDIEGVSKLKGTKIKIIQDRNEIVSFAVAAMATGGEIMIPGISDQYIKSFLEKISEAGGGFRISPEGAKFFGKGEFNPVKIETGPHPAFMTDWQQPFCVLLTKAQGTSIIHETIWEDRFGFTKDLNRMGANIEVTDECLGNPCRFYGQTFNHSAKITGPTPLSGTEIKMTDVRAGMAHIVAALAAKGESIITGIEHVDRGYEDIDGRLKGLGARIERVGTDDLSSGIIFSESRIKNPAPQGEARQRRQESSKE